LNPRTVPVDPSAADVEGVTLLDVGGLRARDHRPLLIVDVAVPRFGPRLTVAVPGR
jgi:hypothetical protein